MFTHDMYTCEREIIEECIREQNLSSAVQFEMVRLQLQHSENSFYESAKNCERGGNK